MDFLPLKTLSQTPNLGFYHAYNLLFGPLSQIDLILAAILKFLKRSRVRCPHPYGTECLDPIDKYSGEKKTISENFWVTPRGFQTNAF
jgi:hypothetical protein